eukprot:8973533-Pyramimonas_sp.AAC.1
MGGATAVGTAEGRPPLALQRSTDPTRPPARAGPPPGGRGPTRPADGVPGGSGCDPPWVEPKWLGVLAGSVMTGLLVGPVTPPHHTSSHSLLLSATLPHSSSLPSSLLIRPPPPPPPPPPHHHHHPHPHPAP